MDKLVFKSMLLIAPIMVLIVGVNYFIDPAHQFSDEYYLKAAKLLKHDNIILEGNCDERKLIKYFVKQKDIVEVLVLGSSRSLILGEEHVNNSSMLNLSTSGSDFEDIIATYELYESTLGFPEKVVIGIDPWMLNISRKSDRYLGLLENYNAIAKKLDLPENQIISSEKSFFKALFSLDYFQTSLIHAYRNGIGNSIVIKTNETISEQNIKMSNGTLLYAKNWQSEKSKIEIAAKRYISGEVYGFNDYSEVSSARLVKFELFFKYLKRNNIAIEVFLSPYHPIVWEYFESNTAKFQPIFESEKQIIILCQKYSIQITGSFSPKNLNLLSTDFYDGMHPNLIGLKKIFCCR